jgi:Dockerin type I domain
LAASIASLDVNGTGPFSNFLQLGDVNNNRAVTAGDALAIIIELNQRTFSNNAG